jgi:hypothetical protein
MSNQRLDRSGPNARSAGRTLVRDEILGGVKEKARGLLLGMIEGVELGCNMKRVCVATYEEKEILASGLLQIASGGCAAVRNDSCVCT